MAAERTGGAQGVPPASFAVIGPQPVADLAGYAAIPSRYSTSAIFEVMEDETSLELVERTLPSPFHKDYDAVEPPHRWSRAFDLSNWALFTALEGTTRLGGALAARSTPGLDMLEGRGDLLVLWDIRVAEAARGRGVGATLLRAVEAWGVACGCTELKVETQNVNLPACRFYRAMGCRLARAVPGAYAELPDEVQLIFRKHLGR